MQIAQQRINAILLARLAVSQRKVWEICGLAALLAVAPSLASPDEGDRSSEIAALERLSEIGESERGEEPRIIEFKETREFPYRKEPIELAGIVRIRPPDAISIEYPDRKEVMILDDEGLLLRKGASRERSVNDSQSGFPDAMRALFSFDVEWMRARFAISLVETPSGPAIALEPEGADASKIEKILIFDEDGRVDHFEFALKGNRRITMTPLSDKISPPFGQDVLEKYFR